MAPHKVNVNTDYCTDLPYCCYGTGQLTVSGVRAAEHVRVRGVAEALTSPGPQVAQVLVILQQGDDNNNDDDDDDDDDDAHLAGHEAALLEAEADQLVAGPAPALATLPAAVSITSNIFV